jgi:hypothetical protein
MKLFHSILIAGCLAIFTVGCATQQKYNQVSSSFPQLSPGEGRIYFYSDGGFGVGKGAPFQINDEFVGYQWFGAFFYVDRPAGNYTLSSPSGLTTKYQLPFALSDGETKIIRFHWKGSMFGPNAEPTLEDKDSGMLGLSKCIYNPNATNRIFNHPPGE